VLRALRQGGTRYAWRISLFYTDIAISEAQYREQQPLLLSIRYSDLDDALGKARQLAARGVVVWEIESEDGTTLTHSQIANMLRERGHDLGRLPLPRSRSAVNRSVVGSIPTPGAILGHDFESVACRAMRGPVGQRPSRSRISSSTLRCSQSSPNQGSIS
jgi:hypothetical protein